MFNDLQRNSFVCREHLKTKHELLELGVKEQDINKLDEETIKTSTNSDYYKVYEFYYKNEDKMVKGYAGTSDVLTMEDTDETIFPFVVWSPINNSNSVFGEGIGKLSISVQDQCSYLLRKALDNVFLSGSPQRIVNTSAIDNPTEAKKLLNPMKEQIVLTNNPVGDSLMDIALPYLADKHYASIKELEMSHYDTLGISGEATHTPIANQSATTSAINYSQATSKQRSYVRHLYTSIKELAVIILGEDTDIKLGLSVDGEMDKMVKLNNTLTLLQTNPDVTPETIQDIVSQIAQLNGVEVEFNPPVQEPTAEELALAGSTSRTSCRPYS